MRAAALVFSLLTQGALTGCFAGSPLEVGPVTGRDSGVKTDSGAADAAVAIADAGAVDAGAGDAGAGDAGAGDAGAVDAGVDPVSNRGVSNPACPQMGAQIIAWSFPQKLTSRWLGHATLTLTNTGSNTWRDSTGDRLGNPGDSDPFRDNARVALGGDVEVAPGKTTQFDLALRAPEPPGRLRHPLADVAGEHLLVRRDDQPSDRRRGAGGNRGL